MCYDVTSERVMNMWRTVAESERGIGFLNSRVLLDEEYEKLCRITAEKSGEGQIALICTVYGVLIRSLLCDEESFPDFYKKLKSELASVLELPLSSEEKEAELSALFDRNTRVVALKRRNYE